VDLAVEVTVDLAVEAAVDLVGLAAIGAGGASCGQRWLTWLSR
jgi:hypothetical protein